jgi:hypothetical protein
MRPRFTVVLAALALSSCGTETETFELSFPSVEAFSLSETVRVYAVAVGEEEVGVCRDLLAQVEGVGPLTDAGVDTGRVPICEFRSGGVELPSLGEGLRAYVAVAEDNVGDALFTGCTLRDVYADASEVSLVLAPTDVYRQKVDDGEVTPTGCTVEDRCSGACP